VRPRGKQFYDDLANILKQHIENCFPNIKVKVVGSRSRDEFRRTSDYDYQFCIYGEETTRREFYPKLIACIEMKIPKFRDETIRVELGKSGNVVNVFPEKGGKVSFALEPCDQFEE